MNKNIFSIKLLIAFGLGLLTLNSCGGGDSPEDVIQNFKTQMTEVESGSISSEVRVSGQDAGDSIDVNADFTVKFNRKDSANKMADVNLVLGGTMNSGEQYFDGDIEVSLKTIGDDYYVNLHKLDSSDEGIQSIKPMMESYIDNWMHVASDFIPENIRDIQSKDEEFITKEVQLKELFINTDLFDAVKDYGIETLNGVKVYHYGIKFNEAGIQDYIRKAAIIDGRELTDAEVTEASKLATSITNGELWIGVKDYFMYKAVGTLAGGALENGGNMNIDVVIKGSDYNEDISITAPENAQEFNPLELLMLYSNASVMAEEEAMMEEELMMEEAE